MKKILLVFAFSLISLGFVTAQTNFTHSGDAYFIGNMAIGDEVSYPLSFGFNTLIFRDDRLRILFEDATDSGNYPSNDWKITINDSGSGGENFFRIDDVTGSFEPFKLMAGSRTNAFVTNGNYIGLGINEPQKGIHLVDGDSPTFRLEQADTDGESTSIWDLVGNESSFFIRDMKNSSQTPFRVASNQLDHVLTLQNNRVGIGTWQENIWNPDATLHLNGFMRFEPQDVPPSSAGAGDVYFDKLTLGFKFHNGSEWISLEANTDAQEISVTSNILSISKGINTVDLSAYLDNTDSQTLTLSETSLSIDNGNTVDLSILQDGYEANTDEQNLSLSGVSLSIANGNTVDLSVLQDGYEANTDEQSLTLSGTNLSISGGNTVDLSAVVTEGSDNQTLSFSGTTLAIESGNSVDLSSLLEDIYNKLEEQSAKISEQENTISKQSDLINQLELDMSSQENAIEQLQTEIANLKSLSNTTETTSKAMLFQNYPNPASSSTRIDYYIQESVADANLMIYDLKGQVLKTVPLHNRGEGSLEITKSELSTGQYLYTLSIDGMKIATKKMLFVK